jgi:hypothetical protein
MVQTRGYRSQSQHSLTTPASRIKEDFLCLQNLLSVSQFCLYFKRKNNICIPLVLKGVVIQTRRYRSQSQHSSTTPASRRHRRGLKSSLLYWMMFLCLENLLSVSEFCFRFKIKKQHIPSLLNGSDKKTSKSVKAFDYTGFKNIGGCSVSAKLI